VYLYLINYAKTQPELGHSPVNTFVKDSDDSNPPHPRARHPHDGLFASREDHRLPLPTLYKNVCVTTNPYVRKTAALCVAKLYDLKPELLIEYNFLEQLHDMISDSNPMVRRPLLILQPVSAGAPHTAPAS